MGAKEENDKPFGEYFSQLYVISIIPEFFFSSSSLSLNLKGSSNLSSVPSSFLHLRTEFHTGYNDCPGL